MKTMPTLLVLIVLLGVGYLVTAQEGLYAQRPTVTAVVDVSAVLNNLDQKLQVEAELQAQVDAGNAELRAREEQIRQLQADLQLMSPGTAAFDAKRDEFDHKVVELQTMQNYQKQRVNREYSRQFGRLYTGILEAIDRVAQNSGYDLVLFKEQDVDFANVPREQLPGVIQSRKVLYSSGALDITEQVQTMMNNEFRSATR
jgi:Skp family chaperone for outer membrane proteins